MRATWQRAWSVQNRKQYIHIYIYIQRRGPPQAAGRPRPTPSFASTVKGVGARHPHPRQPALPGYGGTSRGGARRRGQKYWEMAWRIYRGQEAKHFFSFFFFKWTETQAWGQGTWEKWQTEMDSERGRALGAGVSPPLVQAPIWG